MTYSILLFLHILLFAYWLGADLGVYYASAQAVRDDLSLRERLRFLELAMLLDMGPRTALVLLFPVGVHMTSVLGLLRTPQFIVPAVWIIALCWLGLVWWLHRHHAHALRPLARGIDLGLRYFFVLALLASAVSSLIWEYPFAANWIALKLFFYAGTVVIGLLLRSAIARWQAGFSMLEGGQTDAGNTIVHAVWKKAALQGKILWIVLALVAFLGVWKPNF